MPEPQDLAGAADGLQLLARLAQSIRRAPPTLQMLGVALQRLTEPRNGLGVLLLCVVLIGGHVGVEEVVWCTGPQLCDDFERFVVALGAGEIEGTLVEDVGRLPGRGQSVSGARPV